MVKKVEKNKIIKYLTILGITLLLCSNFLQMHFAPDTYTLYDQGYFEYPKNYFLLDGRLVSAIVCFLAGILNIPMHAYIIGMDFIGIIFIGTSIYLINQILENIIKPKKNIAKVALTASCFVLILNQFTLELLLFPESAVMCLGVLLLVVAIKIMLEEQKQKYLKIFLILLIAALCYQCLLNMFPVLAILVYIVKEIYDNRDWKIKLKEFFIEMVKLAIILILILSISILTMKVCNKIIRNNENSQINKRISNVSKSSVFISKVQQIESKIDYLWNNSGNMLPPYIGNIVVATTIILLVALRAKKHIIFQYILLLVVVFLMFIVGIIMFSYSSCGRLNEPLMMIWGVSLIILLAQSHAIGDRKILIENMVYILAVISFIINSIFLIQNTAENIASGRVDENIGKSIKRALDEYETKTGITVTKFGFMFDTNPQRYAPGIKQIGILTERKFGARWFVKKAMDYYCERKFEEVKFRVPDNVYKEKVKGKDYNEFSNDQIIFNRDAVYLVIY